MNPGNRPRRGIAAALASVVAVGAIVVAVVVGTPEEASASGLETFGSCAELEAWGDESQAVAFGGVGAPEIAADGAAPSTTIGVTAAAEEVATSADRSGSAGASSTAGAPAADEGATNVVVEGVDELDVVERLDDRRVLVSSATTLAIVDLEAGKVLARTTVPWSAQVTYDADAGVAWVVGIADDGSGVEVRRLAVRDASLDDAGTWTTPGQLVAARRVGGLLHLVASDGFVGPEGPVLPFGGDAIPCDRVLHPEGPSDPTATLLVTLPVTGDLAPTQSAEVVGSGQLVHVTLDAAYLATPQWSDAAPTTTIHRFDLDGLVHTGSGRVEGTMLNDFSMSEHDGHLRVAVTAGGAVGRPIAIDGGPAIDVVATVAPDTPVSSDGGVGMEPGSAGSSGSVEPLVGQSAPDPGEPEAGVPETIVPETTVPDTTVPEPTVPETTVPATTTTTEPPTTVPETTTTVVPVPEPTVPEPDPGEALNQVVVFDIEGDLDVVGTTERFGHPGETIHGVRFDGATAYAVTFLQTDPFYVLDLADPAAPAVVGEVELPGFSAYLHPVGDDHVVGFGPGEDGQVAAKLFDVSDPGSPTVVDAVVLGGESPVVYDHHAFVGLAEDRFAVPVTSWNVTAMACEPMILEDGIEPAIEPGVDVAPGMPGPCGGVQSAAVELEVDGDQLVEVERVEATLAEPAARAIPAGDGWALLAGSTIIVLDADGTERSAISLA